MIPTNPVSLSVDWIQKLIWYTAFYYNLFPNKYFPINYLLLKANLLNTKIYIQIITLSKIIQFIINAKEIDDHKINEHPFIQTQFVHKILFIKPIVSETDFFSCS